MIKDITDMKNFNGGCHIFSRKKRRKNTRRQ